jgi:HEAT repeat protein
MAAFLLVAVLAAATGFEWPGALDADARDLTAGDDAQRLGAIERLAVRDVARVKHLLIPALTDRDPGVRLTAARVLARAGVPEAIEAATQWITARAARDRPLGLQVLRDAAAFPPAARRSTERALGDGEVSIRIQALDVLAHHELGPSFSAVAAAVDDDNREVRLRAVRILGDARDARAAVPLLARLGDTDRQVRVDALRALGEIGDPHVAAALLRQLSEATDDVRVAAIDALARLKIAAAVPALAQLGRRRPGDDLAHHAQLALGEIGGPEAVEALIAIARDPPTSDELKEGLRRAAGGAAPALIRELTLGTPTSASLAAWALGEAGDRRATPALAAAVERPGAVATPALAALASLADPEAVPALVRAAASPSAEIRRLALDALVATEDDRALVLVPRGIADPDAGVRLRAIRLAAALGGRDAGREVARRLADAEADVRREAALALPRLAAPAPEILDAILVALGPKSPSLGDGEMAALGDALEQTVGPGDGPRLERALLAAVGPPRAPLARGLAAAYADHPLTNAAVVDRLLAFVDEGGPAALAAAEALAAARVPGDRAAPLVRAFGDAEPAVQARLCQALAGSPAGATRLARLLDDDAAPDQVRAAAAWAAGAAPEAREALRRAAADPVAAVASNARAALAAAGRRAAHPGSWAGVRLVGPDGVPWPSRWLVIAGADGTEIWTMTDATGRARATALPPGPLALRVADPALTAR